MAQVTTALIKELRERTAAGMMDCKKALIETDGDIEKAIEYLRKKGLSAAAKKAGRATSEGCVVSYVHPGSRIGVLLEVNCETDFVAGTDDFKSFCHDVAMQVAAMGPEWVRREEVEEATIEKERSLLREKALGEGKPEKIVDRIVDGQISKFLSERVLLEQPFIKESKQTVEDQVKALVAKIGENVQIRRFVRYELGEGLAKKADDFAAEVAAQVKGGQ